MTPQNTTNFKSLLIEFLNSNSEEETAILFNKNYDKIMSMVRYYTNRSYKYKWYNSQKEHLEEYVLVRFWKLMRHWCRKGKGLSIDENFDVCKSVGYCLHMQCKDFPNTKDFIEFKFAKSFTDIEKIDC